ncbi:hypothetical protein P879_08671 [Paragonimus westermani]|uniref:Origin recognition complex subunit 3 n=1 Tax=Paragonimus westermani TaxID=34504 RepID=A0A8T0DBF3_9TREM|nr:hypothetical protein P879_08671 [Paragonimus westermani]
MLRLLFMEGISIYPGSRSGLVIAQFYHFIAILPVDTGYSLYVDAWNCLRCGIEDELKSFSAQIFAQIDGFLQSSYSTWLAHREVVSKSALYEGPQVNCQEIPTALLLAGVNTPDHSLIYGQLRSSVLRRNGCVAVVTAGSDTLTPRSLVSTIVNQFMKKKDSPVESGGASLLTCEHNTVDFNERGDAEPPQTDTIVFTSSTRSTYLTLSEWYHNEIRIADQQLLPDETLTKNPVTRCRRSISQPSDANHPVGRRLRNSVFPRSNQASPKRITRRFTVRPEADRFTKESVPTSVSISSKGASPPATKLSTRPKPGPLVVILPQVESVASSVLEEFIELTSLYVSGQIGGRALPIILVFGLSTTPEVGFEARLSAPTLGRLKLERFTVPAPAVFLEAVLNTLIHFPGFHLTHSMCAYLTDSLFLCLDYSVRNFIRRVQFCMLEHYLNCAHSHLLLTPEKARIYLSSLPSQSLANMVSLTYPSVAALAVEGCQPWPSSTPKPVPGKSPSLVDRLTEQLVVHWRVQYLVPPVLKWLLHLTSHISPLPLGKSFTDLYRLWLKDGLVNSEAFSLTVSLLSGLSKEKLLQALDEAASSLDSPSCSAFHHLWPKDVLSVCHEMLADLASTTRQWRDTLHTAATETPTNIRKYPACQDRSDPLPTSLSPIIQTVTANPFDGRRKMSMRGLRQHLQELAAASPGRGTSPCSRVSSAWDLKRSAFLDWLRNELGRLIPFPSSLPLHEVFYGPVGPHSINKQGLCDSNAVQPFSVTLRRRFNPPYQKCMHLSLVDPGTYLQLPDLHLDASDCLIPTLPDLCILYKLHLESTKMINLYDWLMAFATVIGENVCKDNPPSKQVQVRFFHGLAQLHHLGFIKSTRRKVDHVLRLTWGLTL